MSTIANLDAVCHKYLTGLPEEPNYLLDKILVSPATLKKYSDELNQMVSFSKRTNELITHYRGFEVISNPMVPDDIIYMFRRKKTIDMENYYPPIDQPITSKTRKNRISKIQRRRCFQEWNAERHEKAGTKPMGRPGEW